MPTLEVQEFEHFNYDEPTLSLDEAVKKAQELRKSGSGNFYRVSPANEKGTAFVVKTIPASTVYGELGARVARVLGRYMPSKVAR